MIGNLDIFKYLFPIIKVWVHSGYSMNPGNADYDLCIQAPMTSFTLPEAYLGVTAATGGLSDDHDVMCFTLHSLTEREVGPNSEVNQSKLFAECSRVCLI